MRVLTWNNRVDFSVFPPRGVQDCGMMTQRATTPLADYYCYLMCVKRPFYRCSGVLALLSWWKWRPAAEIIVIISLCYPNGFVSSDPNRKVHTCKCVYVPHLISGTHAVYVVLCVSSKKKDDSPPPALQRGWSSGRTVLAAGRKSCCGRQVMQTSQ